MKLLCMASLAALIFALPVAAQQPAGLMGPGKTPVFADFDGNSDGRITEQEFLDARSQRIAGRATEGRAMRGLSQAADFKVIDTNSDGGLSRDEFDAAQSQHVRNGPAPAR